MVKLEATAAELLKSQSLPLGLDAQLLDDLPSSLGCICFMARMRCLFM